MEIVQQLYIFVITLYKIEVSVALLLILDTNMCTIWHGTKIEPTYGKMLLR